MVALRDQAAGPTSRARALPIGDAGAMEADDTGHHRIAAEPPDDAFRRLHVRQCSEWRYKCKRVVGEGATPAVAILR